ncbi:MULTISPECIES: GlsB/YeaQ/YmgE family stress response membrane protein [unclassified Lysobacter]|uniref:GlsB/YeaQ/YmgE family stress response membrane protein n=1 Tax=unclassified Lysobacter TaxID=2635362 RepID=UPI001C2121C6|nr:GlsB/YeaQ/YmgE family stress response membrane protein [Lysobacter sp. MMG2]MBU8976548.1 GlsB/YeaQ/YmgE family stress response membrane protein [Lysobacter sp. MMG2]
MGSLLYTIIIGAVIGVLARFFKPGADPMGWILTILLGIVGAYIGSLLYARGGIIGFAISIACAVALLFLYELVRKKRA